jgi:hypothetical protein
MDLTKIGKADDWIGGLTKPDFRVRTLVVGDVRSDCVSTFVVCVHAAPICPLEIHVSRVDVALGFCANLEADGAFGTVLLVVISLHHPASG